MQFTTLLIASAAFVLAAAKVQFTNPTFATITAGEPFELKWIKAEGPVSIILRGRQPGSTVTDPGNLAVLQTIDSNLSGGSYIWNVPADIAQDTYALEITDGVTENYSSLFEVIDGVVTSTKRSSTRTSSASGTASETASATESSETESATTTSTRTSTSATRTPSPTASPTAAPAGGMATGLTSNFALLFVAIGALFMLN